jgi:hypothetical protein
VYRNEKLMADYYSVLARAVVNLETDDRAAREELYARARSIIVAELRKQNPKISALTITREQAALEAAVRKLEAELQPRARGNNRRGSPQQSRSEGTEAVQLGEIPKALAAMLFGTAYLAAIIAFSAHLSARSGAGLRRYYPIPDSAWRHGDSRVFANPLIPNGFSKTPRLQPERLARQMMRLSEARPLTGVRFARIRRADDSPFN